MIIIVLHEAYIDELRDNLVGSIHMGLDKHKIISEGIICHKNIPVPRCYCNSNEKKTNTP